MPSIQVNFNAEQFARGTANRIEQSIRSNECNLRQDQKIEDANKSPNDLEVATQRINELNAQIRSFNEYDGLRAIISQHISDLTEDINGKVREKTYLLEEIAPLLKLPLTPFAVVKFIAKLVIGDKLPQIIAAIKMVLQIVRLIRALNELQLEVRRAVKRLEEFVKSAPDFLLAETQRALDSVVLNLQFAIQDEIAKIYCDELRTQGVSIDQARDALSLIEQGQQILQVINNITTVVNNDLQSNLAVIGSIQSDIAGVTGQAQTIDVSSPEAFLQSVENGDADTFVSEADTYAKAIDANAGVINVREFNLILSPPLQNSNVAFGTISTSNGFISSDFSDWSIAKQLDNPSANLVFDITVNDVSKGNVTITTTGIVISNTGNTQIALASNDIINLVNPPNASTAGSNTRVYFTIKINELGSGTP